MAQITTKKFITENIFGFGILLSFIFQIIITAYIRKIDLENFKYLKYNWERPVHEGSIIVKKGACDNTTEGLIGKSIFNSVHFKGTVEGGKNYFNQTIRMPDNETGFGINAVHAVNFKLETFNGYNVCIEVKKNHFNYFDLRRGNIEEEKIGGRGLGYDTLGNYLYEDSIQNIKSDDRNNSFYSDFVISENTPCINPSYGNKFSYLSKLDYYYDRNECPKGKIFPNATELTYNKTIMTISKKDLLEENKILDDLRKLPDYDIESLSSSKLKIYLIPYIGLTQNIKLNKESKTELDKYISSIQSLPLFNSILLICELAFVLIFLVKFMIILSKYNRQKIKSPIYIKPCLMIISVISCIFVCIFFSKVISNPNLINIIKEENALDPNYFELLEPSFKAIKVCLTLTWINLFINIVLAIKYGIRTAIKLAS